MNTDQVIEKMFALAQVMSRYKSKLYGSDRFKVNATGSAVMSQRQFVILAAIQYGIASPAELARKLHVSNSTLSILISKLIQQDMLYKEFPCPHEDNRTVRLHLTPKGETTLNEISLTIQTDIAAFYDALDSHQKQLLKSSLNHFLYLNPTAARQDLFFTE